MMKCADATQEEKICVREQFGHYVDLVDMQARKIWKYLVKQLLLLSAIAV